MTQWGMVIDLGKCIGCNTCTSVCQDMNSVPSGASWRQVIDYRKPDAFSALGFDLPLNCMHCGVAPCLDVCPTQATRRRPDGIVEIQYDLCVGCGYCVVACPYHARSIAAFDDDWQFRRENGGSVDLRTTLDRRGVCTKCDFCLPRVEAGIAQGATPGIDPQATPVCARFCIADAIHFGDLNDPDSNVSSLVREQETVRLHEELGTDPAVHYLIRDEVLSDPKAPTAEVIPPQKQAVWKWPAAVNFSLGGLAGGLYLVDSIVSAFTSEQIAGIEILAPLLVVAGFAILTVEAKRPWRGIYLLQHWRRSWMSREVMAGIVFVLFAGLDWLYPYSGLQAVAATGAAAFVVSQGMIMYRARAIPTWNTPYLPFLFVSSSLMTGGAAGLLLTTIQHSDMVNTFVTLLLPLILANGLAWVCYLYLSSMQDKAARRGIAYLRRSAPLFWVLGIGHLIPLCLLALWRLEPDILGTGIIVLAGMALIAGGFTQKFLVLVKAGYLRAIQLKRN